jgi:hypothetical protein
MMRFRQHEFACPHCGAAAQGTEETIPGVALFGEPVSKGDLVQVDYFGETEVDWDNQRSIVDDQCQMSLVCNNGHSWWASRQDLPLNPESVSQPDQLVAALEIAIGIAQWARDHGADRGFIDSFLTMANDLIKDDD